MKMKLQHAVILLLVLNFGCKNQSNSSKINDFDSFIKSIPLIDLPYSTTCGSCCNAIKLNLDSLFIQKYKLDGIDIVGKLTETDKYVAILVAGGGDYLAPALFVYNKNGNLVSKQQFMGNYCGPILGFYGNYCLNIDKQLQITEIDTALVFKTDTVEFKIIDTLKRDIQVARFKINEQGKIIKK